MKRALLLTLLMAVVTGAGFAASAYRQDIFEAALAMERAKADLEEKMVQVDGMSIVYLEGPKEGRQETLVLIHGFAAIKENWLRMAAGLTDRYHVIALDLPGHGESSRDLTRQYTIDVQADNVIKILDKLEVDSFHVAGNSMGGAISAMMAARYPDRVGAVVLIDPAGIFDFEAPMQAELKSGKNPLIVQDKESFDYLVDFAMEEPPFLPWPINQAAADRAVSRQEINRKIFTDISNHTGYDFKAEISRIQSPVLIMWGTEDRVIDVKNADVFHELIPNSELLIYEDIGHAPMMEIPAQSASDLVQFVQKHRG